MGSKKNDPCIIKLSYMKETGMKKVEEGWRIWKWWNWNFKIEGRIGEIRNNLFAPWIYPCDKISSHPDQHLWSVEETQNKVMEKKTIW